MIMNSERMNARSRISVTVKQGETKLPLGLLAAKDQILRK